MFWTVIKQDSKILQNNLIIKKLKRTKTLIPYVGFKKVR